MRTDVHVTEETRRNRSTPKRDDETWEAFFDRLTTDEEPADVGAWSEEEARRARDAIDRSREGFDR